MIESIGLIQYRSTYFVCRLQRHCRLTECYIGYNNTIMRLCIAADDGSRSECINFKASMNNQLYSEISDPENIPRGSTSYVQTCLQERLQNDINRQLITSSSSDHVESSRSTAVSAQLDQRTQLAADLRRRVDSLSARVDNAARLTALLRYNLITLRRSLDDFISADVRSVMRRVVNEINANRDCIQRLAMQRP